MALETKSLQTRIRGLERELGESKKLNEELKLREKKHLDEQSNSEERIFLMTQNLQNLEGLLEDQKQLLLLKQEDSEKINSLKSKLKKLKMENNIYVKENQAVQSKLDEQSQLLQHLKEVNQKMSPKKKQVKFLHLFDTHQFLM